MRWQSSTLLPNATYHDSIQRAGRQDATAESVYTEMHEYIEHDVDNPYKQMRFDCLICALSLQSVDLIPAGGHSCHRQRISHPSPERQFLASFNM